MEKEEIKSIKAARNGSYSDFDTLYTKYVDKIYRFIFYKTHDRHVAEDLTSNTFLKALENIESYDHKKAKFSTWLYSIARNTVIDHYRTRRGHADIQDAWDIRSDTNIEKETQAKQKLEKVKELLEDLTEQQRDVVILRVWEGLSHKEIAQVLDTTEAGSKMAYSRAIRELRDNVPLSILILLMAHF